MMKLRNLATICAAAVPLLLMHAAPVVADEISVTIHEVTPEGQGRAVGEVHFSDHKYGLLITPDLQGLEAGPHGAHVHENPNCGSMEHDGHMMPGGAAGGHYDPEGTGRHEGPYGEGHLGDLPNLIVEADGSATIPVLAPRPRVEDIRNRSLIIHATPDRYADHHEHMHGTGGPRMYCGVIE